MIEERGGVCESGAVNRENVISVSVGTVSVE